SYVGPITDFFAAKLFTSSMRFRAKRDAETQEEAESSYAAWKEDVDGAGTDLDDFARERFTAAMVKGRAWWLVERPSNGGVEPASKADFEARGLGEAHLVAMENEQVFDWETDATGRLLWVCIYSAEQRRERPGDV